MEYALFVHVKYKAKSGFTLSLLDGFILAIFKKLERGVVQTTSCLVDAWGFVGCKSGGFRLLTAEHALGGARQE